MNATNPITCRNTTINQLTTIDANQLYDYDVFVTQQSNDSLSQKLIYS